MSRWSFPTHNLDIEHRICGVGWFKELWIAEFCMIVFIIIVGLVGSMSFELLSFGWLFFNVIVIECMLCLWSGDVCWWSLEFRRLALLFVSTDARTHGRLAISFLWIWLSLIGICFPLLYNLWFLEGRCDMTAVLLALSIGVLFFGV
jgi:hypothetical protein